MNGHLSGVLRFGVISTSVSVAIATAMTVQAAAATCSSVSACVFVINNSSGPGGEGSSSSGFGLEGLSKTSSGVVGHTAVNATTAGTGKAGIVGYDDATNHNVFNSGVFGISAYSSGVQGRSTYGSGVLALSLSGGTAVSAVAGPSTIYSGFTSAAVVGQSWYGDGIIGIGNTTGVVGFAANNCLSPNALVNCTTPLQKEIPAGAAVTAATDIGGRGLEIATDRNPFLEPNNQTGVGATIDAGGIGLTIANDRAGEGDLPDLVVAGDLSPRENPYGFQGAVIAGYNALSVTGHNYGIAVTAGAGQGAGSVLWAQSGVIGSTLFTGASTSGAPVAELDDSGNLTIAGNLTQRGTFTSAVRNVDGTYSAAYGVHSSSPTLDDMGEANLVSGAAYIPFDAALLKSIDISRGYLVFLTPQGQTTGLYVTGKSRAGFAVREIGSARDSIAFDYRIVARPYGEAGQRLAPMAQSIHPGMSRVPLFYRHITPLRFVAGKLDRGSLPKPSL